MFVITCHIHTCEVNFSTRLSCKKQSIFLSSQLLTRGLVWLVWTVELTQDKEFPNEFCSSTTPAPRQNVPKLIILIITQLSCQLRQPAKERQEIREWTRLTAKALLFRYTVVTSQITLLPYFDSRKKSCQSYQGWIGRPYYTILWPIRSFKNNLCLARHWASNHD